MERNKVKVTISGKTYFIQGDASEEYILKLAEYVNDKMEDIAGSMPRSNLNQIAILTALNIADEYFQLKDMKVGLTGELEKKTRLLISMLDEGLIGDIFTGIEENSNNH